MVYYVVVNDETGDQVPGSERYDSVHRAAKDSIKWNRNREGSFSVEERGEQGGENGDSQNTMSYDFITTDDDVQDDNNDEQFNTVGSMWTLGDHSTASKDTTKNLSDSIGTAMSELDGEVDDEMMAVLQDASDLVSSASTSRFECPIESCGLGHSHSDHKHDIRSGFDVQNSFAEQMNFCPYCHCGVNELAMLMQFFGYINRPVFTDQHKFEGVFEVAPDVLNAVYRVFNDEGATVNRAAGRVASRRGVDEKEMMPLGVRPEVKKFFQRRSSIESAANSAPIAKETREEISNDQDALEEMVK
jgi:hypothetical protein